MGTIEIEITSSVIVDIFIQVSELIGTNKPPIDFTPTTRFWIILVVLVVWVTLIVRNNSISDEVF